MKIYRKNYFRRYKIMLFPNPWFDTDSSDGITNQKDTIQVFVDSVNQLFNN